MNNGFEGESTTEIDSRIQTFVNILNLLQEKVDKIKQDQPDWDKYGDIRISMFSKLRNNISSAIWSFQHEKDLIEGNGYEFKPRHGSGEMQTGDFTASLEANMRQYHNFIKQAFIFCTFSCVESSLRALARAMGEANANSPFRNLKSWAIQELGIGSDWELLEFFSNIRHLQHNNGVFFSDRPAPAPFIFRGESYSFTNSKTVDFINYYLLAGLTEELVGIMAKIVKQPKVLVLPITPDAFDVMAMGK